MKGVDFEDVVFEEALFAGGVGKRDPAGVEKSPAGGVGESGDPGGVVSSVMTRKWLALEGVAIAAVCGHLDCNQLN